MKLSKLDYISIYIISVMILDKVFGFNYFQSFVGGLGGVLGFKQGVVKT